MALIYQKGVVSYFSQLVKQPHLRLSATYTRVYEFPNFISFISFVLFCFSNFALKIRYSELVGKKLIWLWRGHAPWGIPTAAAAAAALKLKKRKRKKSCERNGKKKKIFNHHRRRRRCLASVSSSSSIWCVYIFSCVHCTLSRRLLLLLLFPYFFSFSVE